MNDIIILHPTNENIKWNEISLSISGWKWAIGPHSLLPADTDDMREEVKGTDIQSLFKRAKVVISDVNRYRSPARIWGIPFILVDEGMTPGDVARLVELIK